MKRAAIICFALSCGACLDEWNLEGKTYPCREPADCAEGFFCHPGRFVCVTIGTSTVSDASAMLIRDAGFEDAAPTALIGDRCSPTEGCASGTCVDGYCCETPCDGLCQRCDINPGTCSPAPAGTDPDGDCGGAIACETLVYGLRGTICYAYAPASGERVCDGAGACIVNGCEAAGSGEQISQCGNATCLQMNACPQNAPRADWDTTAELCAIGAACGNGGLGGCCSETARCCPTPACSDADPLCQ